VVPQYKGKELHFGNKKVAYQSNDGNAKVSQLDQFLIKK
jgi:hypothetical protein